MMSSMSVLSAEDADLFFELFLSLINFTNRKRNIDDTLGVVEAPKQLPPKAGMKIADVLWSNTGLIDEYVAEHTTSTSTEHLEILMSWKSCIRGRFFLERHLKSGSILIDSKDNVYRVTGITTSFEEMFIGCKLPIIITATLLPFKNVIITDGLLTSDTTIFGTGYREALKVIYMDAKETGTIRRRL